MSEPCSIFLAREIKQKLRRIFFETPCMCMCVCIYVCMYVSTCMYLSHGGYLTVTTKPWQTINKMLIINAFRYIRSKISEVVGPKQSSCHGGSHPSCHYRGFTLFYWIHPVCCMAYTTVGKKY